MAPKQSMKESIDTDLITRVDDLRVDLKAAMADLNGALAETKIYETFFEFAKEQGISEKASKTQALKMALEHFKNA